MAGRRPVVLCADDFGLTAGVSRGILDLARIGRLSATGAMTTYPGWVEEGPALLGLQRPFGIGLHFNLTSGRPLGPMPRLAPDDRFPALQALLRQAVLNRLPLSEIEEELERQLAQFVAVLGREPDFVDGHQHVHALPGVRGVLFRTLGRRGLAGRAWLRDPADGVQAIARRRVSAGKALTVAAFAAGFGRQARAAGFGTNQGFSGFSRFDRDPDIAGVYETAFAALGPRPLVMCHPGHADEELARIDPVVASRPRELAYFASERFGDLLHRRDLALVPRPTGIDA